MNIIARFNFHSSREHMQAINVLLFFLDKSKGSFKEQEKMKCVKEKDKEKR